MLATVQCDACANVGGYSVHTSVVSMMNRNEEDRDKWLRYGCNAGITVSRVEADWQASADWTGY